jgi:hypothetical protein
VPFTLDQILGLVGTLDDAPGTDTPRERFRAFLRTSVGSLGAVRDYVEACTKNKGPQYDHALQDLVNHAGALIGFAVEFGRYKGVPNDVGHDGLWRWSDFTIVVEVKTTDAFSIQTATVVGYVDRLISKGAVADWDHAMGLYVFGRTDSQLRQLANSIVAEKRTHQLRIATVDDILSLAELVQEGHISADEAVALLKPGGVFVADAVRLLARIAARATDPQTVESSEPITAAAVEEAASAYRTEAGVLKPAEWQANGAASKPAAVSPKDRTYLITPVSDEGETTAKATIAGLLNAGWYVFADKTPGRKLLKPGDRICFYESGVGVVAKAEVASVPERKPPAAAGVGKNLDKYAWSFRLRNARLFFDAPVVIDAELRSRLDRFTDRDPSQPWAWFVQSTKVVTEHDFEILTANQKD